MPLPADELLICRQWIGNEADGAPSDAEFEAIYNVYTNYDQAVLHVLRSRLAALSLDYGSVTVPGISVSHSSDLQALESLIKRFLNEGTGLEVVGMSYGFATHSMKINYPR